MGSASSFGRCATPRSLIASRASSFSPRSPAPSRRPAGSLLLAHLILPLVQPRFRRLPLLQRRHQTPSELPGLSLTQAVEFRRHTRRQHPLRPHDLLQEGRKQSYCSSNSLSPRCFFTTSPTRFQFFPPFFPGFNSRTPKALPSSKSYSANLQLLEVLPDGNDVGEVSGEVTPREPLWKAAAGIWMNHVLNRRLLVVLRQTLTLRTGTLLAQHLPFPLSALMHSSLASPRRPRPPSSTQPYPRSLGLQSPWSLNLLINEKVVGVGPLVHNLSHLIIPFSNTTVRVPKDWIPGATWN